MKLPPCLVVDSGVEGQVLVMERNPPVYSVLRLLQHLAPTSETRIQIQVHFLVEITQPPSDQQINRNRALGGQHLAVRAVDSALRHLEPIAREVDLARRVSGPDRPEVAVAIEVDSGLRAEKYSEDRLETVPPLEDLDRLKAVALLVLDFDKYCNTNSIEKIVIYI